MARRFLGAFHPDAEFALTEVVIRVGAPAGDAPAPADDETPADAGAAGKRGDAAPVADEPLLTELPPPPDRYFARARAARGGLAGGRAVRRQRGQARR